MSQTSEMTFTITQTPAQPSFTHQDLTPFAANIVLSASITDQLSRTPGKVISLGVPENEPIDDAIRDMDKLTEQSFNDVQDW